MRSLPLASPDHQAHVSFMRTAPYLRAALLLASGGGFALACILTLSPISGVPLGTWWEAVVQTHGHLQLFGWAGMFVIGVALTFLPRLRGTPLARPALLPWILSFLVSSLLLRFISQPLLVLTGWLLWDILLILSGVLEILALAGVFFLIVQTISRKPATKSSMEGLRSIAPLLLGAFSALLLAGILNLFNCITALANGGLVPVGGDEANITLGLFGFLLPVALAMSSRMLPLYAHIQPFPTRLLWILALTYFAGVICWMLGILLPGMTFIMIRALGFLLIGLVMLSFTGYFLYLIRSRIQSASVGKDASRLEMQQMERSRQRRQEERSKYGPYIALIGSAYLWASFGALLLLIDAIASFLSGSSALPVSVDAVRHSFAVGFITLLICGISVRLVPGLSSKAIRSPMLVSATLLLGNLATLLRVGSLLLTPVLPGSEIFFALSGPVGLILILCLTVNLWSAL